jgi:hypothetical protein
MRAPTSSCETYSPRSSDSSPRFMLQVKANRFLCQLIRIAAFTCSQFAELGFLFGSEMYFHNCESWQVVCSQ